jgi:hypothetical protein
MLPQVEVEAVYGERLGEQVLDLARVRRRRYRAASRRRRWRTRRRRASNGVDVAQAAAEALADLTQHGVAQP